jgi:hypothetical protein
MAKSKMAAKFSNSIFFSFQLMLCHTKMVRRTRLPVQR